MSEQKMYGYARVSTREQKADRQLIALREAGVPADQIYVDKMSGKDFERSQYKKMLRKLSPDSVLFVKSIDRLGRNYSDLQEQWRIITKEKGADVVVLDMPLLDTRQEKNLLGTFISDLVLALLSYVSETERTMIRQRQAEGIAAAQEAGTRFGRPSIPLPDNFDEMRILWRMGRLTMEDAAGRCEMAPKTFFAKVQKYETMLLKKQAREQMDKQKTEKQKTEKQQISNIERRK